MKFQYTIDEKGNISNPKHISYPINTMEADREWYFEGYVKSIRLEGDKKSFTVFTERILTK